MRSVLPFLLVACAPVDEVYVVGQPDVAGDLDVVGPSVPVVPGNGGVEAVCTIEAGEPVDLGVGALTMATRSEGPTAAVIANHTVTMLGTGLTLDLASYPSFVAVDGDVVRVGEWDGTLTTWDTASDTVSEQLVDAAVQAVAQVPGGLVAGVYDYPQALRLLDGAMTPMDSMLYEATAMKWLPVRGALVTAGQVGWSVPAAELRMEGAFDEVVASWPEWITACGAGPTAQQLLTDPREEELVVISGRYGWGHLAVLDLDGLTAKAQLDVWDSDLIGGALVDGRIVTVGSEGSVRVWNPATLEEVARLDTGSWTVGTAVVDGAVRMVGFDGTARDVTVSCR